MNPLRRLRERLGTLAMSVLADLLLRQARRQLAKLPLSMAVLRPPLLRLRHRGQLPALRCALQRALRGDARPCLPRSLVLHQQARALGMAPVLVMGAARASLAGHEALQAHAWVELDGRPYGEAAGFRREDFLETFRSGSASGPDSVGGPPHRRAVEPKSRLDTPSGGSSG